MAEVRSDADADRLFVGWSADEVSKATLSMTKESYKFVLPFDPHGVKFRANLLSVNSRTGGGKYQVILIKITDGTATIKSYLPTLLSFSAFYNYGPEKLQAVEPQDETRPVPGLPPGYFYRGGRGLYLFLPYEGIEVLHGRALGENAYTQKVGESIFRVSATSPTIRTWPGDPHIVVFGSAEVIGDAKGEASPIGSDPFLKVGDRIVYVK